MRFSRLFVSLLISVTFAACASSQTEPEITVKGTLSQVGNAPFHYLAVRTQDDTLWKLDVADQNALLPLVNQQVVVSGTPEPQNAPAARLEQVLHVHSILPAKP